MGGNGPGVSLGYVTGRGWHMEGGGVSPCCPGWGVTCGSVLGWTAPGVGGGFPS